MNHTTTDAAEARALEVFKTEWSKTERHSADFGAHPWPIAIRAALAFATAEAASGAGEREPMVAMGAALAAAISLLERGGKKAAPSDKMFEQMLRDYRRALDNGRAAIASLPPATDPAMVEKIARLLCQQHGADPDATAIEPHDCWEGQLWTVFQGDARSIIAALAAAPTIPATGHAATEGEG